MTALIIKPKSTIFGRLRSIVPVIFTCVTILLIYSMAVNTNISNSVIVSKACYLPKQMDDSNYDESIDYLKDIAYAEPAPRPGQSIFFHETSCSSDGMVRLTARYVDCDCVGVFQRLLELLEFESARQLYM